MNDIQKQENASPLMLAAELVQKDGNMDVEKLSKLLEVQERFDAIQARKAYTAAMAAFKENPPEIIKDRHVQYRTQKGQTDYDHATLANVTACINKALSEHGLAASWATSQDNGCVRVTCRITHIMGHSEETTLSAPPDTTGSKNAIQAIGSTVTYLQRYTLLALTGLATYDQDDDGNGAGKKPEAKPKSEQDRLVETAFLTYESKHQSILTEPDFACFEFDLEKFKEAIIKRSVSHALPTQQGHLKHVENMDIPPEEVLIESKDANARSHSDN